MNLADKLNLYCVSFELSKSGVKLEASPDDDGLFDASGNVVDSDFAAFLGDLEKVTVWIDYDPRSRDAGLVCCVELGDEAAWYDATGECAWADL